VKPPDLPTRHPLGHFPAAFRDPLALFSRARDVGGVVRMRFAGRYLTAISDPAVVREVFVGEMGRFSKKTPGNRTLALALGQGLLTIDHGDAWKRQRRIATPAFHRARIATLAAGINRACAGFCDALPAGGIDVVPAVTRLSLRIAGEALLGRDVSGDGDAIRGAIDVALPHMIWLTALPLGYHGIPTPGNRRFHAAIRELDRLVYALIAERRANPGDDLLSLFLDARDDDGTGLTDVELRDEALTLLMAGHETVATALGWALWLLAGHPQQADAIVEQLPEGALELVDLERVPRLTRAVSEALRLFPPVWLLGRIAVADCELGGFEVPAGGMVATCTWAIHRHPKLWDRPDEFVPDRWKGDVPAGAYPLAAAPPSDPAREAPSHGNPPDGPLSGAPPRAPAVAAAYLPFGAGPRKCIGDRFAELELVIALAWIVRRFRIERVDPGVPRMVANITVRPRDGLRLRFTRR
jgi:cytochrome P450